MRAAAASGAIRSIAQGYEMRRRPDSWNQVEQSSRALRRMGRNEEQSMQLAVLQDALNRIQAHRFLGNEPQATIVRLKSAKPDELKRIVDNLFVQPHHMQTIVPIADCSDAPASQPSNTDKK